MEIQIQEIISYAANLVFITWGIVSARKGRRRDKDAANFFVSAHWMAKRLSRSLRGHAKHQAQDLTSFLLSATMNFMRRKRNEIIEIEKNKKQISWWKEFFKIRKK